LFSFFQVAPDRFFPEAIKEMKQCQQRMAIKQARARVSHHILDLLSHCWFITMHFAIGTVRLIFLEYASVETFLCIIKKLVALRAKFVMTFMLIMTVNMYHGFNSFSLPLHSALLDKHA
jgi:hypothetical protein